jgi:hypothetical protein
MTIPPLLKSKVVIKLTIQAKDGTDSGLYHRVRLTDSNTTKEYQQVQIRAIQYATEREDFQSAADASDLYKVGLMYHDPDGDRIGIASNEDLYEAFQLYQEEGNVKVTATVQLKASHVGEDDSIRKAPEPLVTPKGLKEEQEQVPVSSRASVSTQTLRPQPTTRREPVEESNESAPTEHSTPSPTSNIGTKAFVAQPSSPKNIHVDKLVETMVDVLAVGVLTLSGHVQSLSERIAAKQSGETDNRKPPAECTHTRPFIHGRHTCDACLTTPIVGKRFHATNLPDYDLCGKCKLNYKGDEIQFEAVEMDRDRPFQERWHSRHLRLHSGTAGAGRPRGSCGRGRGRCGPRGFHRAHHHHHHGAHPQGPSVSPTSGSDDQPMSSPPNASPLPDPPLSSGKTFPFSFPTHVPAPSYLSEENVDLALKEAIRRSMQDIQPTDKKSAEFKFLNQNSAALEEGVLNEESEHLQQTVEAVDDVLEVEPDEAMIQKTATDSQVVADCFANDAVGSGDIAAVLGETLDKVAQAIEDFNLELSRETSYSQNDEDADEEQEQEQNVVVEPSGETEHGATIVDGEATTKDDASHHSWEVVADDEALARAAQVIGSALFNSAISSHANENLSMLTQSDGANDCPSSESFSSVASVPTVVSSIEGSASVPHAQLQRWFVQLDQLHELGFHNDAVMVEILERLEAANIGVDSSDEVSVSQVVEQMMKD